LGVADEQLWLVPSLEVRAGIDFSAMTLFVERARSVASRCGDLRGDAVQWNPGDDWCDAGELLAAHPEPNNTAWTISGQIVEIARRPNALTTSFDAEDPFNYALRCPKSRDGSHRIVTNDRPKAQRQRAQMPSSA
jgi:hypothetical protein